MFTTSVILLGLFADVHTIESHSAYMLLLQAIIYRPLYELLLLLLLEPIAIALITSYSYRPGVSVYFKYV
jgi:hypothetical protein